MKTGVEMAIWAYKTIEKSSPKGRFSSSQEFDYSLYHIVPGEFDRLDELIEFLKTETPGLRWERDNEIIHRLELAPDAWEAIFRCWQKDPGLYFYIALGRASCWCRHCQCDAPATQHDLNGDPRCDECEEIGVDRFERFCLRQTKNGRRCPKCGDDIRWEAFEEGEYLGTCGCERWDWRRGYMDETEPLFLMVKELPVLDWEEVPQRKRDPGGKTDHEWRAHWPFNEYICGTCGGPISIRIAYELVHFPRGHGAEDRDGWCLCVHDNPQGSRMFKVGSREEGELLAARIEAWRFMDLLHLAWLLGRYVEVKN